MPTALPPRRLRSKVSTGATYHQYLDGSEPGSKFKVTYFGSVGYLTEFGAALVFRGGLISSPDNRFNPELMAYGERAPSVSAVGRTTSGVACR